MSTQPEPAQPEEVAIRRRNAAFVRAAWEQIGPREHPDTWCSADRDRSFLIELLDSPVAATAAARAEPGRDDAHIRTPEGPDDYCTGCGELWPCSFERGKAAARAEVARQVREAVVARMRRARGAQLARELDAMFAVEDAASRPTAADIMAMDEPAFEDRMRSTGMEAQVRGALSREDAAPRQPEPEKRYVSLDDAGPGFLRRNPDYQGEDIIDSAAPDTTTEAQQPPEVREPER